MTWQYTSSTTMFLCVCVVLLSFHICPEQIPSLYLSSVASDHFILLQFNYYGKYTELEAKSVAFHNVNVTK